jgi:hypothetical protein
VTRDDATIARDAIARQHDPFTHGSTPQLISVSKTKRRSPAPKALSFAATTVVLSLLASHARAELHETTPVPSLQAVQPLRMEIAPRASLMTSPFFLLLPIGISGRASFRSSTRAAKRSIVTFGDNDSLCLGARCAPRIGSMLTLEPGAAEKSGSTHAVESIGIGKAALALFKNPVPKTQAGYAFGVSPMFACGGGGLEIRLAWF